MDTREKLMSFFLLAMRSGGYAAGGEYQPVDTGVGVQMRWEFEEPNEFPGLKLVDQYLVDPDSKGSTGYTEIVGPGKKLLWLMTYNGSYPKEVVPFLKRALLAAYQADGGKGMFLGGRGLLHHAEDGLVYTNCVTSFSHEFEEFIGFEEVRRENGEFMGRHIYSGYLLAI